MYVAGRMSRPAGVPMKSSMGTVIANSCWLDECLSISTALRSLAAAPRMYVVRRLVSIELQYRFAAGQPILDRACQLRGGPGPVPVGALPYHGAPPGGPPHVAPCFRA